MIDHNTLRQIKSNTILFLLYTVFIGGLLRRNLFICHSACAAIIFKLLRRKYFSNFELNRAAQAQIRLEMVVFQSNVIKVKKKH